MRRALKNLLEAFVDQFAHLSHYSFPKKYSWRWKLDVLLKRYEPETTRLILKELKPGETFVDIGAHIGYFTRIASKRVGVHGHVIAFEADTENGALLAKNTTFLRNVTRVHEAIGDTEGRATFYHVRGSSGCHSLVKNDESDSYEVPVTTLDAYVARTGITVDFIKMDIEGGEWNALQGMEKTLAAHGVRLVIEYNPEALAQSGIQPRELLFRLHSLGFSTHAITPRGLVPLAADFSNVTTYLEAGSVNIFCTK